MNYLCKRAQSGLNLIQKNESDRDFPYQAWISILRIEIFRRVMNFKNVVGWVIFLFGVFWFLLPGLTTAQSIDADVDFYALPAEDNKPYLVGDRITLRLEVTHPEGSKIDMYPLEEQWGDFEVVDQSTWNRTSNENGFAVTRRDIVVTLFEPGQYQTPLFVVEHRKPDGSIEELGTPVIRLNIVSILEEGDNELRDIKEQAILPVPPIWPYLLSGLVAAFLVVGAIIGGGLWYYHRWRNQGIGSDLPLPAIDARPPEVIAYAELDRIMALKLPYRGEFKEHYSLITDCLRYYIERRYHIPALDRTTDELRSAFGTTSAPQEGVREFMNVFSESDLVKFARFRPDQDDAALVVNKARHVIELTTPLPEPFDEEGEPTNTEPEVEITP